MRRFFTTSVLFVALGVAFSNFTACTDSTSNRQAANRDGSQTASGSKEIKNNDYPPAPSAVVQAELKDLDGNTFKIEDKKGKVVLVNLWAIWCGPCVAEMPEFSRMQDEYKDKGFEVIGLNTGTYDGEAEPIENIKKFIEQRKINYQIASEDGDQIYEEFNKKTRTGGIPQSMVINREGQMIFIIGGGGTSVVNKIREAVDKAVNE